MVYNFGLVCIVSAIVSIGLLVPNIYALHNSEDVTWQLVMMSSYPACSNYHYQQTQKYNEITQMYLDLYEMPNKHYEPQCMTEKNYISYVQPDDLDLLVLVYDRNMGRAELYPHEIGGIYTHEGEWTHNHAIVICDCPNFEYSDPVWLLSHEISHFVLNYHAYDMDIIEKEIHVRDSMYDYCVEVKYEESCANIKTTLHTDYYSYDWVVMTPYKPAIGKDLIPVKQKENPLDIPNKQELFKEITAWWIDGKISYDEYMKSVNILIEKTNYSDTRLSGDGNRVILTELPKDKKIMTDDSDTHKEFTDNDAEEMLKFVPRVEVEEFISNGTIVPQWFKTRASWMVEGKISPTELIAEINYLSDPYKQRNNK